MRSALRSLQEQASLRLTYSRGSLPQNPTAIAAAPCSTSPDKGHIEIATIGLMSRQTGVILAEVGFLLILFAGVWLVAAQIPAFKIPTERTIVAGIALALGGLLLIIATHWGHFGRPS